MWNFAGFVLVWIKIRKLLVGGPCFCDSRAFGKHCDEFWAYVREQYSSSLIYVPRVYVAADRETNPLPGLFPYFWYKLK